MLGALFNDWQGSGVSEWKNALEAQFLSVLDNVNR